ncbi:MAG: adenine deaminase [Anaeroplasma sp.]
MTTLLKNGHIVNVFTNKLEKANLLMNDEGIILGIGDYDTADIVEDVTDKVLCPGFIDGHIHIESTTLMPSELARVCMPHGTVGIVADPHEICNVCGLDGLAFMISASEGIPLTTYIMLPSCVPPTIFDESGSILTAKDLKMFYSHPRVLGLAEIMNYPGVINNDKEVLAKINDAKSLNKIINGHAPLLSGKSLDKYICSGIYDDHECSNFTEAVERISKGQWVMIREGTSARNLTGLINLFDDPYYQRCLLVTDDKHPKDLLENGHIDSIIRKAVSLGKNPIIAIRMASLNAAQCFNLRNVGALAPGYKANVLVLNDLNTIDVKDVYINGVKVVDNKKTLEFHNPIVRNEIIKNVSYSFYMNELSINDFYIEPKKSNCRVIEVIPNELLTNELITKLDFTINNGIDIQRDILKIAVCERHNKTNHIGIGFIKGIGIKKGAIASSVAHDSHNLVVVGTNDSDMVVAGNAIRKMGGGLCVVENGKVIATMSLPIAGLMTMKNALEIAKENDAVRNAAHSLGSDSNIEPFMVMAFMALPVIPHLKITSLGIVDVNNQKIVSLFVEENIR